MPPEIMAELVITGSNIDPEKITKTIGINPTRTWRVGDSIQNTALQQKYDGWCISTGYHQDFDLEKYARELLKILLPKAETITTFCQENGLDCELSFATYVTDETPTANFSKEFILDLAKLNASLDIDIILTAE